MTQLACVVVVAVLVAAGCGSTASRPRDDSSAVIESVRNALGTDRIEGAELDGSRLTVRLRAESAPGEAAISLWYGKLLVQEVVNRLKRPVIEAVYTGTSANGGCGQEDLSLHAAGPAPG